MHKLQILYYDFLNLYSTAAKITTISPFSTFAITLQELSPTDTMSLWKKYQCIESVSWRIRMFFGKCDIIPIYEQWQKYINSCKLSIHNVKRFSFCICCKHFKEIKNQLIPKTRYSIRKVKLKIHFTYRLFNCQGCCIHGVFPGSTHRCSWVLKCRFPWQGIEG